jgi:hypothetical protein
VRRLGGDVDDQTRAKFFDQTQHSLAIPYVDEFVAVTGNFAAQAFQNSARIAFQAKKTARWLSSIQ